MVFVCIDFAMQQLPAKYVINFMFFCAGFEQSELNFDLQSVWVQLLELGMFRKSSFLINCKQVAALVWDFNLPFSEAQTFM